MSAEKDQNYEQLTNRLDDVPLDSVDLQGNVARYGHDRSLERGSSGYDEDSGPGGASGIADDPGLGGSTGLLDDVGMHIEPGFSLGYSENDEIDENAEAEDDISDGKGNQKAL